MGKASRNSSRAFKRARTLINTAVDVETVIKNENDYFGRMLEVMQEGHQFDVKELIWLNSDYGKEVIARSFLATDAWLKSSRVVFDIDPTLLNAITEVPVNNVPVAVLDQLPYDTFAFHSRFSEQNYDDFNLFVYAKVNEQPIIVSLCMDDPLSFSFSVLHDTYSDGMIDSWDIERMAKSYDENGIVYTDDILEREVGLMQLHINVLAYLSSDKPDINMVTPPEFQRRSNTTGLALPTVYRTGWNIGAALRQHENGSSESGSIGLSVRPHLRKAHWHLYWTGPRTDPKPLLKWLSPIPVNAHNGVPVKTIRSVA